MEGVGRYRGTYRVREGREGQLAPQEIKRFLKNKELLDLELRADGTFTHKAMTHGTWTREGDHLHLQPTAFGAQTRDEMQAAAEDAGRVFSLAFLFDPIELRAEGPNLVTADDTTLIYTLYEPE